MIKISHTTSKDNSFLTLIKLLDAELWQRYPEIQNQYEEHARIDFIKTVIVAYKENIPVACGCFVAHDSSLVEIKRMFVHPAYRGHGLSKMVLNALEQWAKEMGYNTSILETGKKQPEAISLYKKLGYQLTENFGPYKDLKESLCFIKRI